MAVTAYGLNDSLGQLSDLDANLEEISLQGFTVIKSVFDAQQLQVIREKVRSVYQQQEDKTGKELLALIGDEHICRCPMAYDSDFLGYATHGKMMQVAEHFLGNYFILSVQNANISRPGKRHLQSSWHRDLPYQNFTTSSPLALNFLIAVDDFTADNGGVAVIPFSHKMESMPSATYIESHALTVTANAGDAIAFNSMLIHRAGSNLSSADRLSFNHMYTRPFIKQQYDYASIINRIPNISEKAFQISGATSRTAADDMDWRLIRKEKMKV